MEELNKEGKPKYKTTYSHSFTELSQILEFCNSQGIDDDYLIDGLKNGINEGHQIKKPEPRFGGGILG